VIQGIEPVVFVDAVIILVVGDVKIGKDAWPSRIENGFKRIPDPFEEISVISLLAAAPTKNCEDRGA
jgi:hypothetical protein